MPGDTTKQKILDQALNLFAKEGYDAVSVEQIAVAVGIKAPSLYKHYKSKRAIFDSIIERMDALDRERASRYDMPQGEVNEAAAQYLQAPAEAIKTYSRAQFSHWTEEAFPCNFRRLLTLEQYKSREMSELYQRYLADGPLEYIKEVFFAATGSEASAMQLALEFYGPIFLLYSVYDGAEDAAKASAAALLDAHMDRFISRMNDLL